MTTDLVVAQSPAALSTVMGVSPKELMAYAIEIADTLTSVLRDRGMTQKFGAGEHVRTEGWQLAGSLMGFVADEGAITELPDGSYEAQVHLRNVSSGKLVASASARCGVDEKNWKNKDKFNRRSMAVTRAIGRAYAQNFRWLIKLAGFEGTLAEEMPSHSPGFDPDNLDHIQFLEKGLEDRNVPKEKWVAVAERMRGRQSGDLDVVLGQM